VRARRFLRGPHGSRDADTVDEMLRRMIADELLERDPGLYYFLQKEDRMSTYVQDRKRQVLGAMFQRFFRL